MLLDVGISCIGKYSNKTFKNSHTRIFINSKEYTPYLGAFILNYINKFII